MRLTGKGIKRLNYAGRGDQFINIRVKVPKYITDKQKALIQAWAELETDTPGTIRGIKDTVEDKGKVKPEDGATVVDNGRKRSQDGKAEKDGEKTFFNRLKARIFGRKVADDETGYSSKIREILKDKQSHSST
ncbi:unnamed protein product [Thelazia callipaeda]|uniref:DnaJ_C domain-containing protein n=1 Tax=Thelazia callipaeda TaxID=103827 RepID=A0A0N5CTJ2_THECL|nr:unnamed protein product [Thelazia callipaeda]